jgi:argonaute-like protein implicated in RNA metabolism and viral defense
MMHRTEDRARREEDQLAAAVVRELFERHQLRVGVMHCDTVRECYQEVVQSDGQHQYLPDPSQRGKLSGYLRNVALNKILLINRKWPFILADRLHADITIGIDVKNNTCGLLVVGRFGADIRPFLKTSRQKEQLQPSQVKKYLCEVLRDEASDASEPIRTIVIHRDGTLWPSELEGAQQAIAELKQEGVIPLDTTLTILEIAKSSPAPLRLYGVTEGANNRPWIENAEVGDCYIVNDTEAYLCTTGQPFLRQGTARPLYVKRAAGLLPLLHCIEDLYALSVLAWTQPEGCTRYPISLKLNDRYLRDEATDYDADAIDFAEFSDNEEVA